MIEENLNDVADIYSKPGRKTYETNKTRVKDSDITWSLDFIDMIDNGKKSNGDYRYISAVNNRYSLYGLIFPISGSC